MGNYTIGRGTLDNTNYTITYKGETFSITPLAVSVTADQDQTKVYGSANPTAYSYTSIPAEGDVLANGEAISFTGALSRAVGENVGNYTIGKGTLDNANYTITYSGENFSITPLEVRVTADPDQTKVYGAADPLVYTYTSNPAVGTVLSNAQVINFAGVLIRELGEETGSYTILQGSLNNGNYSINYQEADFYINCLDAPEILNSLTATGSGSSNPPVISNPGSEKGDLLIVGLMYEKGASTSPSAPVSSGWKKIRSDNQGNNVGMITYYKIAGSNEPSSYQFGLSSSPKWSIGISLITRADTLNPIDAHNGDFGNKSNFAVAPSITPTVCNTLVMAFFSNKRDAYWTPPNGTVEVYDRPNSQNGLTSNMMARYLAPPDNGVSTGSKSAEATISEVWVAQQIAIRPGAIGKNRSGASSARTSSQSEVQLSDEQPSKESFSAYPNPIVDRLSIQFPELTKEPSLSSISIFDQIGRSYPVNAIWHSKNASLEIDFSVMTKGLYIIRVSSSTGVQALKVQKE